MPARMLYISVVGFSVGIFSASMLYSQAVIFITASLFVGIVFFLVSLIRLGSRKYFSLCALFFIFFTVGAFRVLVFEHFLAEPTLESKVGSNVTLQGVIVGEIDVRENAQRLLVEASSLFDRVGAVAPITARVLVSVPLYPRYSYGDEIRFAGKLRRPEAFETDSGRIFDYASYLKKDGVLYMLTKPKVERVAEGRGSFLRSFLLRIRAGFIERLSRVMPEPENSLLAGLLVGAKRSLGEDISAMFRAVGLIHIVVLSGYNLTIIAQFFMALFSRLGRQTRLFFGALSIIIFALTVGLSATVVRASLMAVLALLAEFTYRRYDVSRALALTAFLMLLHDPMILAFDPSFQLSFLATIGLIYVSPVVIALLPKVFTRSVFKEIVVTTLSTQIFVTPYLLYLTGNLSLIALVSNIIVLPVIPLAMLAGFLAGVVSLASPILAVPFTGAAYFVLSYVLSVSDLLSRVPFASVSVPAFPWWLMALIYIVLVLFLFIKTQNGGGQRKTTGAV